MTDNLHPAVEEGNESKTGTPEGTATGPTGRTEGTKQVEQPSTAAKKEAAPATSATAQSSQPANDKDKKKDDASKNKIFETVDLLEKQVIAFIEAAIADDALKARDEKAKKKEGEKAEEFELTAATKELYEKIQSTLGLQSGVEDPHTLLGQLYLEAMTRPDRKKSERDEAALRNTAEKIGDLQIAKKLDDFSIHINEGFKRITDEKGALLPDAVTEQLRGWLKSLRVSNKEPLNFYLNAIARAHHLRISSLEASPLFDELMKKSGLSDDAAAEAGRYAKENIQVLKDGKAAKDLINKTPSLTTSVLKKKLAGTQKELATLVTSYIEALASEEAFKNDKGTVTPKAREVVTQIERLLGTGSNLWDLKTLAGQLFMEAYCRKNENKKLDNIEAKIKEKQHLTSTETELGKFNVEKLISDYLSGDKAPKLVGNHVTFIKEEVEKLGVSSSNLVDFHHDVLKHIYHPDWTQEQIKSKILKKMITLPQAVAESKPQKVAQDLSKFDREHFIKTTVDAVRANVKKDYGTAWVPLEKRLLKQSNSAA